MTKSAIKQSTTKVAAVFYADAVHSDISGHATFAVSPQKIRRGDQPGMQSAGVVLHGRGIRVICRYRIYVMPPDQLDMDTKLLQQLHCLGSDRSSRHCVITSIDVDMCDIVGADVMHLCGDFD
ncbi:hypothetical protein DSM14862_03775 (plasmid) [Sulfitobacter indolifex]|nr:hypothetical protein DSM14862_03332 [Sulfitobacter indolifex]UOA20937.1 hypothetical protein DSM14862_03775 [Sulfitobacter indolifex]